jgi:plastocyanin
MSVPLRSLRLLPKPKSELDRLYGNKGEIFYDSTSGSLRLFDGAIPGGTQLNVSVSISDTPPSYPTQGSLWFNSATGAIYLYYQDSSSSQWVAPIVPAGGVGGGGATNLDGLSDVAVSSAVSGQILLYTGSNFVNYTSRLFHQFAYPAITALDVTNSGATAYLFNNQYSGNNPTVYAISGTTIAFNLSVVGHPFLIQTSSGVNYNTGLIHVDVDGTVSTGTSAQGKTAGTLYWQIPSATIGNYQYICSIHSGMVGVITIKSISAMA